MTELKVGDEVDVYVENKENKKGQLILSRKKAKLTKAWDYICEAHQKRYHRERPRDQQNQRAV